MYAEVSPFARRVRLGAAIRQLRGTSTTTAVARAAGIDRTVVSKIEAGERRAGLDTILKVLDVLPIGESSRQYRTLQRVARDGLARGWWDDPQYAGMGERQVRTADLECGATIREYQSSMLPGLLQTEAYARHRGEVALGKGAAFDLEAAGRGRLRRQRQVLDRDASDPVYHVVLEPQAIWRCPVPRGIMREQLRHLHKLATTATHLSIRILPVDAPLGQGWVPRAPFSVYDYGDPDDLTLVVVDTVTTDLLITEPAEAADYAQTFDELRENALSAKDSAELIQQAADAASVDA
ncbi:Scr1 family TA system antitoxin-like transcriptional regulator [Micromonospora zhanjiangensis]|uniref:Scr1 family TA system antitoxin-like transcriptional regulator n=1 Tax=Micromonospora zhanjiangensis TaxID=1522057 RepID=A0ABV8KI75_9ACTN